MASGAPDGVLMIQVAVTIDNVAVVPPSIATTNYYTYEAEKAAALAAAMPAVEAAAGDIGTYTGTDTNYQTVASWTVAAGKTGELKEILILSNDYAKTLVKITVGSVVWCTDWAPSSSMPIIFEDLRLDATTVVKVEVKSSDGTSITVDAIIVAKEIG